MVGSFVAPNNYTFADSLILVSILLLGGIGNPWGLVVATIIVVAAIALFAFQQQAAAESARLLADQPDLGAAGLPPSGAGRTAAGRGRPGCSRAAL